MTFAAAPELTPDEVRVMMAALTHRNGDNDLTRLERDPDVPVMIDLAERGLGQVTHAGADALRFAVSVEGARRLVAGKHLRMALLASGAGRLREQLCFHRRVAEAGFCDPSLGDGSVLTISETPHARAAAAVLIRHGHAEVVSDPPMMLRATDLGMAA